MNYQLAFDVPSACPPGDGHIRMGVPGDDWSRDELDARAVWEHERIDQCETYAPRYWFLGKALREVRKDMLLPQWKAWRDQRALDRTRCDRAQLLARAFESADQLHDTPLLVALALANELLGRAPRQTALDAKFRRWLKLTNTKARERLGEMAGLAAPGQMRPLIADLARSLVELDRACAAKANRPARDGSSKSKVQSSKS